MKMRKVKKPNRPIRLGRHPAPDLSGFGIKYQGRSLALHLLAQTRAPHFSELVEDRIRVVAEGHQPLFAGPDHARLAQDRQVFGSVRMTRSRSFHELADCVPDLASAG
jgi:hypothetical protein